MCFQHIPVTFKILHLKKTLFGPDVPKAADFPVFSNICKRLRPCVCLSAHIWWKLMIFANICKSLWMSAPVYNPVSVCLSKQGGCQDQPLIVRPPPPPPKISSSWILQKLAMRMPFFITCAFGWAPLDFLHFYPYCVEYFFGRFVLAHF